MVPQIYMLILTIKLMIDSLAFASGGMYFLHVSFMRFCTSLIHVVSYRIF